MKWKAYVELKEPIRNEDVDRVSDALRGIPGIEEVRVDYNGFLDSAPKNRVYQCTAVVSGNSPEAVFEMTQGRIGAIAGVRRAEPYLLLG